MWAVKKEEYTEKLKSGDYLIFYVKGTGCFRGIFRMVGDWYESYELLWHNEESEKIYPFEIKLDRLVIGDVEFNAIRESLEFSRPHHKKPGIVLMGMGIGSSNFGRPIPESDKDSIYSEMMLKKRLVDDSTFLHNKKNKNTVKKPSRNNTPRHRKKTKNPINVDRNNNFRTRDRQSDVISTRDGLIDGVKMVFDKGHKLSRMSENKFKKEYDIEKIVSSNLSVIFPCLTHLKNQFSIKVPGKSVNFRFDTLALDVEKNCFVVIEYKKRIDHKLIDQVLGYKSTINTNKSDFMDAHGARLPSSDYNWDQTYMIIISPEYAEKQVLAIQGLEDYDRLVKMYEIRRFGSSVITLDRVGGGTPVCEHKSRRNPPQKPTAPDSSMGDGSKLIEKFDQSILRIGNIVRKDTSRYIAYKDHTGKNVCVVMDQKNRLKVYYGVRRNDGILYENSFVKYDKNGPRYYGSGEYCSIITSFDGIARASELIKKAYNFLTINNDYVSNPEPATHGHDVDIPQLSRKLESAIMNIGNIEKKKTVIYTAYKLYNGINLCTVIPTKRTIKVYYATRKGDGVLYEDSFVLYDKNGRHYGAGDYKSIITDYGHIDRLVGLLEKLRDWKEG